MKNIGLMSIAVQIILAPMAHASVLILENPDGSQLAVGADPNPSAPNFQMWRCGTGPSPSPRLHSSATIAGMRAIPEARCAPVTQNRVNYIDLPGVALQASQDWAHVLSDETKFNRIVREIETGIKAGRFHNWHIDSNYVLVGLRVGNTEYKMYVPKNGDVKAHILGIVSQRFNGLLSYMNIPGGMSAPVFTQLPMFYWDAVNRPAVELTYDPNFLYHQAENFAEMAEWAESQARLNRECYEMIVEYERVQSAMLRDLTSTNRENLIDPSFLRRNLQMLTRALPRPIQDLRYEQMLGNQCAQKLNALQLSLAQNEPNDAAAFNAVKPETAGMFADFLERLSTPPESISGR